VTPREIVTTAIEFEEPPRLPVNGYGDLSDVTWVGYEQIKPPEAEGDDALDQWLCRWGKTDQPNMGQVKGHPLADLARMTDFPWPDGNDPRRYVNVAKQLDELAADPDRCDKFVVTGIFMILWERMHSLHGFEASMLDLMDDTPAIHQLADHIVDYDIAVVRNMHRIAGDRIQALNFTEDWGTQTDLHVSPELWRRFFFPRYQRIFDVVHECGWYVWMHSCGKINKAIPGLIEAGVDVLNMQQPRTNGIQEIARKFTGQVCFESLCDIQKTLPGGNREEISAEVEELMLSWGTPDGGFILGDYGDHVAIGARPATKAFMLAEFLRLDPWVHGW